MWVEAFGGKVSRPVVLWKQEDRPRNTARQSEERRQQDTPSAQPDCSEGKTVSSGDIKIPSSSAAIRIPLLKKRKVSASGRVPKITGEPVDLFDLLEEEEALPTLFEEEEFFSARVEQKESVSESLKPEEFGPMRVEQKTSISTLFEEEEEEFLPTRVEQKESAPESIKEKESVHTRVKQDEPVASPADAPSKPSPHGDRKSQEHSPKPSPKAPPKPSPKAPPNVVVKIVPTPVKRKPRSIESEKKTTAVPPPPKQIKVIRRRREEAPKVFETTTNSFPRAMLKGLKTNAEEDGDSSLE